MTVPAAKPKQAAPARKKKAAAVEPDDLAKLKGIGTKSAGVLLEAGIATFAQLAEVDVDRLEQVLKSAGVRVRYVESWPKQAALAAQEEWKKLERMQTKL